MRLLPALIGYIFDGDSSEAQWRDLVGWVVCMECRRLASSRVHESVEEWKMGMIPASVRESTTVSSQC